MTTLHRQREVHDMRFAFRHNTSSNSPLPQESDSDFDDTDRSWPGSNGSYQTQATSRSSGSAKHPQYVRGYTWDGRSRDAPPPRYFDDREVFHSPPASPSSSVDTYASTVDSEQEQPEEDDRLDFDVPDYRTRSSLSSVIVATPSEFSDLFPSSRPLHIRHDDSTIDGNMNLRVDTAVSLGGHKYDMTLFHLRLQDLKHREFSLRRYCRDSGREVCHSIRKHQSPATEKRPAFQRSLSNALQSMRSKSERGSSAVPTLASLKRNDSGYASMHSVDFDHTDRPATAGPHASSDEAVLPNTIKLEFSNYAQVEVKRCGGKGNKRYEFQYWGVSYAWRRVTRMNGADSRVSYYLMRSGSDHPCASIEPVQMSPRESQAERNSGGWIPPCRMVINDAMIFEADKGVADTIVAAGLIALVDDTIRSHFQSDHAKHLLIPVPKFGVEYVGPKRLISEMFGRREASYGETSRPSSSGGSQRPNASSRQSSHGYSR